jgi:flagellin
VLSILTNGLSLGVARMLDRSQLRLERHGARLASGLRINSAKDDAAGLAIASRMQAQRRGMDVDLRSLNDMVSLIQVAEGALGTIGENLQRIRELALQAANGTNQLADRLALQLEADQLIGASRNIQSLTEFNGLHLLDGSLQLQGLMPLSISGLFLSRTTSVLFRYAQMTQASTTVTPGGSLQAGDLTINGKAVPASAAGAGAGQSAGSAWAIASAINQAGVEGLTVTANAAQLTGSSVVQPNNGIVAAGDIVINGVSIGAGNIVGAINAKSGQTGVTASVIAGAPILGPPLQTPYTLVLTAGDGRDIDVSGAGGFGLGDSHATGSVAITGPLAEGGNLAFGGNNPGSIGLATGTIIGTAVGDLVPVSLTEADGYDFNPDMSSVDGAQATIGVMDRKLEKLFAIRVGLGATLAALDARRSHLAISRDTVATTISRIEDADYAEEMVALTKENILRQTALAMAAQANAESRRLLALLLDSTHLKPR